MKKIVIITGSCGLVGSEAVKFLKKKYQVIGIDNNFRKELFGKDGDTTWIKKELIKKLNINIFKLILEIKKINEIFKRYKKYIKLSFIQRLNLLMIGQKIIF